jgi:hypothetical protein
VCDVPTSVEQQKITVSDREVELVGEGAEQMAQMAAKPIRPDRFRDSQISDYGGVIPAHVFFLLVDKTYCQVHNIEDRLACQVVAAAISSPE